MERTCFLVVTLCCFVLLNAFPDFADEIPNGKYVQHPCKPNSIWKGVGHHYSQGGGKRNKFGEDFLKFKTWTQTLCQMDSDNDGMSNGHELGDPNCIWVKGADPKRTENITHPGVCDPADSQKCTAINTFIDCKIGDFKCSAINENKTFNRTVRFHKTIIPAKETNYYCMYFDFPSDDDYHLVATQPFIDNHYVIHHILVYGCNDKVASNSKITLNVPEKCGMFNWNCQNLVAAWTVGLPGQCSHKDTGFRIGKQGYKRGMMQVHWNNPKKRSDYEDSSGITFFLQPKERPYDSGVLMVGQYYLEIPPDKERVTSYGICSEDCTKSMFLSSFNVTNGLNHMHYMGRQGTVALYRTHKFQRNIAYDEVFSYDSPETHTFDDPIIVNPGDEIKVTCVFNSLKHNRTTFFGQATADEMCLGFVTYYPKENVSDSTCASWKSLPTCKLYPPQTINNCDVGAMLSFKDPEAISLFFNVSESCTPFGNCSDKCLEVLQSYKNHPCLIGDVGDLIRTRASRNKMASKLFLGLDSCKIKNFIHEHQCQDIDEIPVPEMTNMNCNLEDISNQTSQKAINLRKDVKMYCKKLYTCLTECLDLLKNVSREYPCLFSEPGDALRSKAINNAFYYDIFVGLDSCKLEYYKTVSTCGQGTKTTPNQRTEIQSTTTTLDQKTEGLIDGSTQNRLSVYFIFVIFCVMYFQL